MTLAQVAALRRLLVDPLERERLRGDVEALVGAGHEPMPVPLEIRALVARISRAGHRPPEALQLVRRAYVTSMLAAMDDAEVVRGALTTLANTTAGLAVLAGRDHEARRWLRIAELEAEADGLDGRETVLAWWRAVEIVAGDR